MSLILVIEQDGAYTERIRGALTAEGWTVRVVGDHDSALAAARQTSPDLAVVSTATRRAADLFRAFGRRHGGPGAFALIEAGEAPPADADGSVAKPFTDEQLRMALRRCLSRVQRAAAEAAAAQAASAGEQLTSQDLFGDLLAEVEAEVTRSAAPPKSAPRAADDMDRKLEQTLSGVMRIPGAKPSAPAAPPSAAPREAPPAASGPVAPAPPAAPPAVPMPPAAQAPVAPVAPAPPPPAAPVAAAPAPPVPQAPQRSAASARSRTDTAVDDLLTQTLSGLGVSRPKAKPAAPAAAATPPAAIPLAATAPAIPVETPRQELPREEPPRQEAPRQEPPAPERGPEPPRREPEPAAPAYREPPPTKPSRKADKRGRREATGDVFAPPPPLPTPAPPAPPLATQRVEARPSRDEAPRDVPFGQYTLLERVAIGGMAEVWKARMRGVEGFQKTVAIKKILPHLTDSVDFVTMFIDEAKLAAQLNHPHIIHIYDLGKIEEDYYIAMEYVEGKDLRSILNTARREGTPMPLGLAMLVASRLAGALDYAHRKRDFDNRELGLVHRDVSPQNVLISYEGDIKLCDFGIAKAVAKASKTQMGALKGKLQYMSPEQAWGRVVDSRSDVFSLGAVLFEMLTGRRLFAGESEISVLESVREARTQSVRDLDPAIPEPVDAIVRRALAKDPDDRFQTAGEMQKEIDGVLHSLRAGAGQADLAAFMHRLHGGEVAALSVAGTVAAAAPEPAWGEREVPAVVPIGEPAEPEARRRPWLIPAAAAAAVLVALAVFLLTRGPSGANPPGANEGGEPAAAGDAAAPVAPQAAVATQPVPATADAVVPGTGAVPAAVPASAELQQRVEEGLRAKQQQLDQQLEAQRREIQAELQREAQPAPTKAAPAVAEAEPVQTPAAAAPPPPPPPAETPVVAEERPAPRPPPRPAPALQEEPARPTVSEGDLVAAGTPGLSPPGFVSFSKPEYPPLAKRMRVEGTVVVGVLVDESGQVQEARLVRGVSQNVGLNEAALRAARTARYRPATMTGVRVKTWVNLTIPFKL